MERILGRVTGAHDGRPVVDGVGTLDVANAVWCTGFRQVFDWIEMPIFGAYGLAAGDARRGARRSRDCSSAGSPSSTLPPQRCCQELAEMPLMSQRRSKPEPASCSHSQPESPDAG